MDDVRSLVGRARAADGIADERVGAFGELVRRFQDMVVGYAYSVLGDFHLAEDAAQDAFITAYRKLDSLREPGAFAGWLRRLVRTSCDRITRRKKVGVAPLEAADGVPSGDNAPAEAAERAEMREVVLRAIRALPEEQRTATTLFYINGYSHAEIAEFLEIPESTVNNRLHASRERLKERTLMMVKDTLHEHAPDERFSAAVIEGLLERPDLLAVENHPVRQMWETIQSTLTDYDVIAGDEVENQEDFSAAEDHAWDQAYRVGEGRSLRYQMTTVTMSAIRGRTPPVRLLAAGRVFRPEREDPMHAKVFSQVDGVCIAAGMGIDDYKDTCERLIRAALPDAEVEWSDRDDNRLVSPRLDAVAVIGDKRHEVLGGGMLTADKLTQAGFDTDAVSGFAWGTCLDRLAMLRLDLDDIHKLWQPPYVPE